MLQLVDWLPGSSSPWTRIYTFADAATENLWESSGRAAPRSRRSRLLRLTSNAGGNASAPWCWPSCSGVSRTVSERTPGSACRGGADQWHHPEAEVQAPELWDPDFLDSLPGPKVGRRQSPSHPPVLIPCPPCQPFRTVLCTAWRDRSPGTGPGLRIAPARPLRGMGLGPSLSYRVTGEQIDGSFRFDGATYLLGAKWVKHHIGVEALYPFRQKVTSKSAYTRGLFLAVEGFSTEGVSALGQGQEQRIILLDGGHLAPILASSVSLPALLAAAVRHLEQRGERCCLTSSSRRSDGPRTGPGSTHWEKAEFDAMLDAANDALMEQVRETIHEQSQDTLRGYLGTYGDAISARIDGCLDDARAFIAAARYGPAVTSACTAIELPSTISSCVRWSKARFSPMPGRRYAHRHHRLVPAVPRAAAGHRHRVGPGPRLCPTHRRRRGVERLQGEIWPLRRRVVHQGVRASEQQAGRAVECAEALLRSLVELVAVRLERAWPADRWSEPAPGRFGAIGPRFDEEDPFEQQG